MPPRHRSRKKKGQGTDVQSSETTQTPNKKTNANSQLTEMAAVSSEVTKKQYNSGGVNKHKAKETSHGGGNKSVGPGTSLNPEHQQSHRHNNDAQIILSNASPTTSFLSYKIPKINKTNDKNTYIASASVREIPAGLLKANESVSPHAFSENAHNLKRQQLQRKRKSGSVEENVKSNPPNLQQCPTGHSADQQPVTNKKLIRKESNAQIDINSNTDPIARIKLKARRSGAPSCPDIYNEIPQNATIDTPQMAMLKERIANCNEGKKKASNTAATTPRPKSVPAIRQTPTRMVKTPAPSSASPKCRTPAEMAKTPRPTTSSTRQIPEGVMTQSPRPTLFSVLFQSPARVLTPQPPSSSAVLQTSQKNTASIQSSTATTTVSTKVLGAQHPVPEISQFLGNGCNTVPQFDTIDAMDVDMMPATTPNQPKQLLIIIDTNVWLSHQNQIQEILVTKFSINGDSTLTKQAMLVIPWMVLQEIDHKIKNSKCKSKSAEFRNASKFINGLLSTKHPRVKGQKAAEAIIGMEFKELMADDSILNCAIQYSKLRQFITVFITNDINLLNKAMVHDIPSLKADERLVRNLHQIFNEDNNHIEVIKDFEDETNAPVSGSTSFLSSESFSSPGPPTTLLTFNASVQNSSVQVQDLEDVEMDVDDPMEDESSSYTNSNTGAVEHQHMAPNSPPTFEAVATALQQTLTSIIVPAMVKQYGTDDWRSAIKIPPPFTVQSGFKCIHVHWIAVFSYVFPSRGGDIAKELITVFKQKPRNDIELKNWRRDVCQMAKIFLSLENEIASRPRVADCCRLLEEYVQYLGIE